jgi:hypothetical protein
LQGHGLQKAAWMCHPEDIIKDWMPGSGAHPSVHIMWHAMQLTIPTL